MLSVLSSLAQRLSRTREPVSPVNPDLHDRDLDGLLADMRACLASSGVSLSSRRRLRELVALHRQLTPLGVSRFAQLFNRLEISRQESSDRYSVLEEAELFGSSASKLSILQAMESPRRRMLALFAATPGGTEMLEAVKQHADPDLCDEIDRLTVSEGP